MKTTIKILAIAVTISLLSCSCASTDFNATSFRPVDHNEKFTIYEFKAFADAIYPNDSVTAEKQRIKWLQKWIKNNNLNLKHYEIVSRSAVLKHEGLLGTVFDIYYKVKIHNY